MLALRFVAAAILLVPPTSSLAQTGFPDQCPNGARFPFAAIKKKHPIDETCSATGAASGSATTKLQNSVKNNFCGLATNQKPETFTPQMLVDLQKGHRIPSGRGLEPANRKALQQLGEGKVIRMKAFLIEAHHADLGTGESVNCKGTTEDKNDIHIALGPEPHTRECDSVTAEISPHFRPDSWNEIGHFEKWNPDTRKYVTNVALASRLQSHPYRITGQLFFDASHAPCPCTGHCEPPLRASVWEIHPVYAIEVCKTGTPCNENNDSDWLAFDDWWKALPKLQPGRKAHDHPLHERGARAAADRHH